jgi:formylglycine-generating enzyme required for sulfatase activity
MKKLILLSTVLLLVLSFTNMKKEIVPPGTVKINDTLFADETEVSNFSWLAYETWIKNKYGSNSSEYKAILPDTTVWRETGSYNEPYVQYYLRHPAYRAYPVVGVSYEQAIEFCKWKTEKVAEYFTREKKHSDLTFEFRLPSKKEWEFLSSDCIEIIKNNGRNKKGQVAFNHRWAKDNEEWMKEKEGDRMESEIFAPVLSYWPNNLKLYNMLGNVAEMVSEKGISKGGSWTNVLEECRVEKDIPYSKPSAMIGFRCVCVIKKTKA